VTAVQHAAFDPLCDAIVAEPGLEELRGLREAVLLPSEFSERSVDRECVG
jgi:hypothetical protein